MNYHGFFAKETHVESNCRPKVGGPRCALPRVVHLLAGAQLVGGVRVVFGFKGI